MPHAKLQLFSQKTVVLSAFAKALSHPARIEILNFLHDHGPCICNAIVAHIPLSQPSVSRHLSELKMAGLIQEKAEGNSIIYSLEKKQMQRFCEAFSHTIKPSPR
jgi:DNA-binding transcriptional ArsR family regulator